MNNDNNFNIENRFINYGKEQKEKKKSKKIIFIIILIILLGVAGYLFYVTKIEKESNNKSNNNYEEYDPNYKLEESNSNIESNTTSNITTDITSNITSNIIITSNIVSSNSNQTSNTTSKIAVSSISFTSSSTGINVGGSKNLSVIFKPTNATNKSITWYSSNTDIVTVDQNGKITGKKVGTATITATTKDGNKKATCKVTVTANTVAVSSIKLNISTLNLVKGESTTLSATITPTNATNQSVIWSSSNSNVVSVDQNGNIMGVNTGTATITATTKDGGKKATCTVNISAPTVSSISINSSTSTNYIGYYIYPTITYNPSDATGKSVKWYSSNTSIATVNSDGRITGISEGDVTITARTPNGISASKTFYIRENPANFEIVFSAISGGCNKDGCHIAEYSPIVYKNGKSYSYRNLSYNGKTYYKSENVQKAEINNKITTATITTTKGNKIQNVKVTYKTNGLI